MKALALCGGGLVLLVTAQAFAGDHGYHRKRLRHATEASPPPEAAAEAATATAERWSMAGPHLVLGLERAARVSVWSLAVTEAGRENKLSGVDADLLGFGSTGLPLDMPRVGFDGVFDVGLTLGLAAGYSVRTATATEANDSTSDELPTQSTWLVAPRVGVLLRPTPILSVWLRSGVTYLRTSASSEVSTIEGTTSHEVTLSNWELTLDPQLLVLVAPRVAITLGSMLDLGITGSGTATTEGAFINESEEADASFTAYGVCAGFAVVF